MVIVTLLLHQDWSGPGPFPWGGFHPGLLWLGFFLLFCCSKLSRRRRSAPMPSRDQHGRTRFEQSRSDRSEAQASTDNAGPLWPDLYPETPAHRQPGAEPEAIDRA